MTTRTSRGPRTEKSKTFSNEGSNWILIAGGALLSTLSIRLGYKLKQALDARQQEDSSSSLKGNVKSLDKRKTAGFCLHSNVYSFTRDDEGCFNCMPGSEFAVDMKCPPSGQMVAESNGAHLPLAMVPAPEFNKENGVIWASSPDRLELPPKQFHQSNCSDSPCVSDSGSDIFSKREVIHKLRQQLRRRDDMILEMQDQIVQLQNSLNAQLAHSTHLQSQLDTANQELFESEREIQRLRKAIADHCVGHVGNDKPSTVRSWPSETRNGHANGYLDVDCNFELARDGERIDMLKKEVGELKEVIEGKEYLLQSYKEQKSELSLKIKELQQKLDSQLPNIL